MSSMASAPAIETSGLRKVYRTRVGRPVVAVDSLDLVVPAGGVHGLLGPNGAGKTTTLRMLLGLARPTRGEIRVLGAPVPRRLPAVMPRVGAVVDEPGFVPSLTGRKNLMQLARAAGVSRHHVDAALGQVGLTGHDRERYAGYSAGMRRRLAIAAALMLSPDLLVLDEPTDGLDPAGARDVRDLLSALGDHGVTVLLVSHNLAEVQQVCHSASILADGRLLASGAVADLVGDETVRNVRVGIANPATATRFLEAAGYRVRRDGLQLVVEGAEHPEDIVHVLADQDMYVRELVPVRGDLETVFLRLTREADRGAEQDRDGGAA
ncbi:MAG: ABC transporter ATP-binding protein [Nocardioides sp.]